MRRTLSLLVDLITSPPTFYFPKGRAATRSALPISRYNLLGTDCPSTRHHLRYAPPACRVSCHPGRLTTGTSLLCVTKRRRQERCGNLSPLGVARQRSPSTKQTNTDRSRAATFIHSFGLSRGSSRAQGGTLAHAPRSSVPTHHFSRVAQTVPIVPPEHSERGLDSGTQKRK